MTPNVTHWLRHGDRGASSESIVDWLRGIPIRSAGDYHAPRDPADLRRCVELLWSCPELIDEMPRMAECSLEWRVLMPGWDLLIAQFLTEVQCEIAAGHADCPRTYALMWRLLGAAR